MFDKRWWTKRCADRVAAEKDLTEALAASPRSTPAPHVGASASGGRAATDRVADARMKLAAIDDDLQRFVDAQHGR